MPALVAKQASVMRLAGLTLPNLLVPMAMLLKQAVAVKSLLIDLFHLVLTTMALLWLEVVTAIRFVWAVIILCFLPYHLRLFSHVSDSLQVFKVIYFHPTLLLINLFLEYLLKLTLFHYQWVSQELERQFVVITSSLQF